MLGAVLLECIGVTVCWHDSDSIFIFPQRVDESFNAAGEEPSPATEDYDPDIACQGKPTSKTQPHCPTFLYSFYHVFTIM